MACGLPLASPRQALFPAPLLWKGAADGPFGGLEDTAFTPTTLSATHTSTGLDRSLVLSGPQSSSCDLLRHNSPKPASCRWQQHALLNSLACREVAEGERGRQAMLEGSEGALAGTAVRGPGHPPAQASIPHRNNPCLDLPG